MVNVRKPWSEKEISLQEVGSKIPNGSNVYIGSSASTAEATLKAMVACLSLADIQIIQMIPGGNLPHLSEHPDRFRTRSFFSYYRTTFYTPRLEQDHQQQEDSPKQQQQPNAVESLADYSPMSLSSIPRLLEEKILPVDVAIIRVTKPHKGFVSLGFGVESTRDFIRHAQLVIAEVNEFMPWTEGPSKISTDQVDYWISHDKPLLTSQEMWPAFFQAPTHTQDVLDDIGKHLIKLIPDGSTLKFGISPLCGAVYPYLYQRQDLGIHTDLFSEEMLQLQQANIITNSRKTIDTGRTVAAQAHGSRELYDFLDRNPAVEFHPTSYINDPQVMGNIDNLVAIIGALKIDLTGQVATDSISHKFYYSVWSDIDSVVGAHFSKGGKSIICIASKSIQGRSNVVFALPPGTGVSITRSSVEYVVTEYGIAYLYGKSIRERCLALINIAHPDFRDELLAQAKSNHYISSSQPGLSFRATYPSEFECFFSTKKGHQVYVRPIKAMDEDSLRAFFHKLSDHSVYLRYFRRMRSMPQRILQKTADIDYSSNMALVALYPAESAYQEVVGIAQWIYDKHDGIPEIAFQVRDDWHGEGLGSFLFTKLIEIARSFGLLQVKADVLADNKAMRNVFQKSDLNKRSRADFGVITYTFDLAAGQQE